MSTWGHRIIALKLAERLIGKHLSLDYEISMRVEEITMYRMAALSGKLVALCTVLSHQADEEMYLKHCLNCSASA